MRYFCDDSCFLFTLWWHSEKKQEGLLWLSVKFVTELLRSRIKLSFMNYQEETNCVFVRAVRRVSSDILWRSLPHHRGFGSSPWSLCQGWGFWAKCLVCDAEQLLPLFASWNYISLIPVGIVHSCSRSQFTPNPTLTSYSHTPAGPSYSKQHCHHNLRERL